MQFLGKKENFLAKITELGATTIASPGTFWKEEKEEFGRFLRKERGVLRQRQSDYKIIYWLAHPNKREEQSALRDLPNLLFIYGLFEHRLYTASRHSLRERA